MELLLNQVAVITGAASGIGEALAIALDKKGMLLVLVDIEKGKLERVSSHADGSDVDGSDIHITQAGRAIHVQVQRILTRK